MDVRAYLENRKKEILRLRDEENLSFVLIAKRFGVSAPCVRAIYMKEKRKRNEVVVKGRRGKRG